MLDKRLAPLGDPVDEIYRVQVVVKLSLHRYDGTFKPRVEVCRPYAVAVGGHLSRVVRAANL